MNLRILYQDSHYVAVDKPAGLLVHRTALDPTETNFALQQLRDQLDQPVFPCHRLDRPTSGVLLFALTQEALRHAQTQFAAQRTEKRYQAVVRGWTPAEGRIDYPLRLEERPKKIQEAVTCFHKLRQSAVKKPVGRYPEARFSLLELRPKTGRKHQIRRHLAHLRHPILGDTRHGDGAQNRFLREHCGRQMLLLRATALELPVPWAIEPIRIEAPEDPIFAAMLQQLGLTEAPASD